MIRWLSIIVCFSCFAGAVDAVAVLAGEDSSGTGKRGGPVQKRPGKTGQGTEVTLRFSDFESGKPVAGFSFEGGCEGAPAAKKETDKSGESRIPCLPWARCRVWGGPDSDGHFLDSGYFYVLHCGVPIQLRPRKGLAIRGTVRDPAGQPIVGAHLQLTDRSGGVEAELETGPGGHFVTFLKAPGIYSLIPTKGLGPEQRLVIAQNGKSGPAKEERARPVVVEVKEKLQPLAFVLIPLEKVDPPAGTGKRSETPGGPRPQGGEKRAQ